MKILLLTAIISAGASRGARSDARNFLPNIKKPHAICYVPNFHTLPRLRTKLRTRTTAQGSHAINVFLCPGSWPTKSFSGAAAEFRTRTSIHYMHTHTHAHVRRMQIARCAWCCINTHTHTEPCCRCTHIPLGRPPRAGGNCRMLSCVWGFVLA